MTALQKLDAAWGMGRRICVGLDSRRDSLPKLFKDSDAYTAMRSFNYLLIDALGGMPLAYKINAAPYFRQGIPGIQALIDSFERIRQKDPDALTILDMKPGDALDDVNDDYAHFAFEVCGADALTGQVYAGPDAAQGFTKHADKLIFFLCKTSNKGSGEFQDLPVVMSPEWEPVQRPLYKVVAGTVSTKWDTENNCGLVVGATYPEQLREIRSMVGDMPILAPGVGKQAGEFAETIKAGLVPHAGRLIINESRSIIFASNNDDNFAEAAARRLRERTEEYNAILDTRSM